MATLAISLLTKVSRHRRRMRDIILLRTFLTFHMPICGPDKRNEAQTEEENKLNPAQVENNIEPQL